MQLGHFRRSTPTAGLELITHVLPLDLFIKQQALMAYYRTTGFSKFTVEQIKCRDAPTLVGHREYLRQFESKLEYTRPESDDIPIVSNWNKQYTLDEASFVHGIPHDDAQINIYVDLLKR